MTLKQAEILEHICVLFLSNYRLFYEKNICYSMYLTSLRCLVSYKLKVVSHITRYYLIF
jgi:hypothetical protein